MPADRRIVIAGHLCLDEIVTAERTVHAVGSPAVFMAPVLEDAGYAVSVAAPYGPDFEAALERTGPALTLLDPPHADPTLVYVNDVRGEVRAQAVRNPRSARLAGPSPAARAALATAAALVFTPLLADPAPAVVARYTAALPPTAVRMLVLQGYLRQAVARRTDPAAPLGTPPAFPISAAVPASLNALFPLVDVVILSDEDLSGLTSDLDPDGAPLATADRSSTPDEIVAAWSHSHPRTAFVVTRGGDGSSAYLAAERVDAPAHPVGALAPTSLVGAGDIFAAELTLALLATSTPPAPLTSSTLSAALTTANRATALRLTATRLDLAADHRV